MEKTTNIELIQGMKPAQIFSLTGDQRVQNVIGRLKFISKIQDGEKINIKDLFVRDNDSVFQRLLRSIKNYSTYISGSDIVESKEATLEFIQEAVNDAITLISLYREGNITFNTQIADIIVKNLEEAKGGIHNSIRTYRYDRRFISHAEAVMQTLEARIKNLRDNGLMNDISETPFMPDFNKDEENID